MTYGGGVQSMMGVTGAQRASAEAKTTIETRPWSAERSISEYEKNNSCIDAVKWADKNNFNWHQAVPILDQKTANWSFQNKVRWY